MNKNKYEDLFRKESIKLNIPIEKINFISCNYETIYNPFVYEYTNRWVEISHRK